MPSFSLDGGMSTEDQIAYMKRTLNWLMQNLDDLNVKSLVTENCNIHSANGETVIDGPVLIMKDGAGTTRLGMGYNGSDFSFNMYDASGNPTLCIDAGTGKAIFAGNIQTSLNASIGNNIYIGTQNSLSQKGIYFYNNGGNTCYMDMDAYGSMHLGSYYDLNVNSRNDLSLQADNYVFITSGEDIFLNGPEVKVQHDLLVSGIITMDSKMVATHDWVYAQGYSTSSGYDDSLLWDYCNSLQDYCDYLSERIDAL